MVQQGKEPVKCFPVQPIKEQVKQKANDIKFSASEIWENTWNRYPCDIENICRNDHCNGKVSFFVTEMNNFSFLKLLFVRENKNAYVYNNRQLRILFENGILSPFDSVTIKLNPPIETEPTERATTWKR